MQTFPFDQQKNLYTCLANLYYCPQYYNTESLSYFPYVDQTLPFYQYQIAYKFPEKGQVFSNEECSSAVKQPARSSLTLKKAKKSTQEGNHRKSRSDDSQEFKIQQPKTDKKPNKKKNTESNIVNQTFSFLCSWKSKKLASLFFQNHQEKVNDYYKVMTKIKNSHKKYINRKYLKNLLQFSTQSDFYKIFLKTGVRNIGYEEIRKFLKALAFHYLRECSYATLLTSSKIYKETLMEHFSRKREISNFLFPRDGIKE